jgi:hypothetical protein
LGIVNQYKSKIEDMNFYNVRVGQETRRGAFNESLSFVCKTETDIIGDIRSHFLGKYRGLQVFVNTIDDVIFEDIKSSDPYKSIDSKSEIRLKKVVSDLKCEVKSLKDKLTTESAYNYKSVIDGKRYPKEVKDDIAKMIECSNEAYNFKESARKGIEEYIKSTNPTMIDWVRASKGFDNNFLEYSYEARLKGHLITINNKEE